MIDSNSPSKNLALLLVLCLFLGLSSIVSAQNNNGSLQEISNKEIRNTAKQAYRLGDTYLALMYYQEWVNREPENLNLIYRTADLYSITRNYVNAEKWFQKLIDLKTEDFPLAYFKIAESQMSLGKYEDAKKNFEIFKDFTRSIKDPKYKKLAKNGIASCEFSLAMKDSTKSSYTKNLGASVNLPHIEFSPIVVDESTIIYGSLKLKSSKIYDKEKLEDEKLPTRKLYVAKLENGSWITKGELDGPFNSKDKNIGNAVLNEAQDRIYFTYCDKNWQNKMVCELYFSNKVNGKWQEVEKLNEEINLNNYTTTQAAIGRSSKNNNEIIYFVSDRPGGKGGLDIWYTEYRKKRNSYKSPRNLGSKVNTKGNEVTPFYDLASRKLYFSSNGHVGFGGYDVFKTSGEKSKWLPVKNMKADINTSADDLDYHLGANKEGGFLISNRRGGTALLSETCCDDIYQFNFTEYVKINLNGEVLSKNNCLKKYRLKLYIKDEESDDKYLAQSSIENDCKFNIKLESGIDYILEIEKEGYLISSKELSTKTIKSSKNLELKLNIDEIPTKALVYNNILFEFNSPNLTSETKNSIDTTILKTLKNNPTLKVRFGAHTDSKGTDAYNLSLSKKRVQSLVKYLTRKGVRANRMEGVGHGESMPIAPNINKDGSDNPEGRKLNRRVELEVIGKVEAEIDEDDE